MKQHFVLITAAVIALVGGVYVKNKFTATENQQQPAAKLNFSLPDLSGRTHNIAEWHGKILIINFWATWCPPCLKEIPEFIKLQQELASKDVQFIGIAIEEKQPVVDYLKTININYPILIAGDAGISLSQQLGNIVNAVPFTIIVNRQGKVIHRHPGELFREKLIEFLQPLLES